MKLLTDSRKEHREFLIPKLERERSLYGSEFEVRLRNELTQRAIAQECAEWMRNKAVFRSNRGRAPMQQFAGVSADGKESVYLPLHGFTAVDLGYEKGNAVSNFVNRMDEQPLTTTYLSLFDQIWNDPEKLEDVTAKLCEHIASVYQENSPQRIYFLMLYNIFSEFLEDISEDVLPNDLTGYQDSLVWKKLFNFQRDAATGIINKLETYNGCILADSVGLGKTFTALAVVKYYELRNKSVLVLCPKKLADNWLTYKGNLVTNIFAKDRFGYDVLCHTDLLRESGYSFGLALNRVNWGNYDLVVIDESHNFRNNTAFEERETRYQRLLNQVVRQGVKTKVLMLSATPVNNRFADLKNQLALAYEGDPENLSTKLKSEKHIDEIFRRAQAAFNAWSTLPSEERTAAAILNTLDFDFFEVLDSVTIARSRRHIQTYYDTKDIGTFPERLKPLSFHCQLTHRKDVIGFNEIFEQLSMLTLAVYAPLSYVQPSRLSKYQELYDPGNEVGHGNLGQSGREKGIQALMTVNLLKRLESSVHSFRLTLKSLANNHERTLEKIAAFKKTGHDATFADVSPAFADVEPDQDDDMPDPDDAQIGNKVQISLSDMDLPRWEHELRADLAILEAVKVVVDCFAGQPKNRGQKYALDPGRAASDGAVALPGMEGEGFANDKIAIPQTQLLENLQGVQRRQNLPISTELKKTPVCDVNLDVEMETGTGKTYCYIKTMFELNRDYGWSKFIVVVPSIAIREGVLKSFEIMAEHFLETYGKKARHFVYNSKQLHNLESFSSDAGINVMIINVQAFAARGEDAKRIFLELDDFQSRKPIDVIAKNRPILILDEPQKMEGTATVQRLKDFAPLMILRYSATHKTEHNKVYRLDAIDAYNQKLVKKIKVRGITVKGLAGTNAYLYLESIRIATTQPPEARAELEIQQKNGINRVLRMLRKNDNLYDLSDGLEQYRGFVVSDINAIENTISFTNGVVLGAGEATGDVNEAALRRIQIREAIKAHFETEQALFAQGIKVLSLFFIDEVAKYRSYDDAGEQAGEYAQMFEEEYNNQLNEVLTLEDTPYNRYLKGISAAKTHNGYFSIDKKTKRLVNPDVKTRGESAGEAEDADAYDLILRDKERLLTFSEPVRFLFSHSALREGWDNSNVFVICTLKHSDNTISRRQEVGRGMRLSRNQSGDRIDDPAIVHQVNVLTVVANESYKDFVAGLQRDISASLSARPQKANAEYFTNKVLKTETGDVPVTAKMAAQIEKYLTRSGYSDDDDKITDEYHTAKKEGILAALPPELEPYKEQVFQLINSVFSAAQLPEIEDDHKRKVNSLNANFEKKEFQELWSRINRKAIYAVDFKTDELVEKCIKTLDKELKVTPLQYTVTAGEQTEEATCEAVKKGEAFVVKANVTDHLTSSARSEVKYDLIGKLAEDTKLTRQTIAAILRSINVAVFAKYKTNPEDFILKAGTLINEQKAAVIVEHIAYDTTSGVHEAPDIFTEQKEDLSKGFKATRHIYDYVFTDSGTERTFVGELDASSEVVVYAKLPKSFQIPTPVGNYNPDWAIAFNKDKVKHVYFIAETKGSMSSMDLRKIEDAKIECARKFLTIITADQVKYDVVHSYGKLMELLK